MAKKEKIINQSFFYDRLWEQKLSQIYQLLVPDPPAATATPSSTCQETIKTAEYENSSHLHEGVLRGSEGE